MTGSSPCIAARSCEVAIRKATWSELSTALAPIFVADDIPSGQSRPYVSIGDFSATEWKTKTQYGEEVTGTFYANSAEPGAKQAAEMVGQIMAALTQPMNLEDGFRIVTTEISFHGTQRDPDGLGRRGVVRVMWRIQDES